MSEILSSDLCESAKTKAEFLKKKVERMVLVDKETYREMQEEAAKNKRRIEEICKGKEKLKKALAEAVEKRNAQYKQYIHYKHLYESLKGKRGISKAGKESLKHAEKDNEQAGKGVKELFEKNSMLSAQLSGKIEEISMWKEAYSASKYIRHEAQLTETHNTTLEITFLVKSVVQSLKGDTILYKTFKEVTNCSKYFFKLIQEHNWEEALLRLLRYFERLLKEFKIESLKMRTPSFCPFTQAKAPEEGSFISSPQVSLIRQDP